MKLRMMGLLAATAISLATAAQAETVKIGVVPGAYADSIAALVPEAKEAGIDIEAVEFTDWTTPNVALDAGDIDLNYFQHRPFLDNAIADRGYKLTDIGVGILANIGLYSLKHKSFDEIPDGGKVAIANDPVNQGRGLLLLERAGLIKLKEGVGFTGTLDDITENPRNLEFTEVEGPQLARITADVDLALGYPHFIAASGLFDPGSGLIYSGIDDRRFSIIFTVKEDRKDEPALKKVVELYQNSPAVKKTIAEAYHGNDKLYTLSWQH
ncbi:MetQ/NlpA family ABC transporter substrate-binding protein [Shinella sp. AETb1-6]|jgi:D-methionine transport system substrate-binding protein|uniref:MetQ/NlpA family ABC transporter substrate-binding protein n=1 Tax=Shinella sp. AETb1-6 TaxID=2692210 RepID=UPI00137000ED|nr:MetQ/NlpA family ABC transporter substrate-binding protein [Shinella sp. AETb1-6]MXN53471.1 MetQ/NlpA family ABC transporter substrate-binding protein [Shinella sp. AETb1-6]